MKTTLLFILTIFSLARVNSQPGTLDSSFGTGGHLTLGYNFTATAFQTDGKLVGVRTEDSEIVVNRYNTDGSADAGFGTAGAVKSDLDSFAYKAVSVAVGNDGKFVVLGQYPNGSSVSLVLLRYYNNGTLDPTFGSGGFVREPIFPDGSGLLTKFASLLSILNNGKVVVTVGFDWYQKNPLTWYHWVQLLGFDVDGSHIFTHDLWKDEPNYDCAALVPQADGKIILAGHPVVRFTDAGVRDSSFGNNGEFTSDISLSPKTIAVQPDGKILVSVQTGFSSGILSARLFRLTAKGTLDLSFGNAGIIQTDFDVIKIELQDDGKIITAFRRNFRLSRYNFNGTLDETFGTTGKVINDFGDNEDISDMRITGDRLYGYGSGILAAYDVSSSNTTGILNTATGYDALHSNTTGNANTAYGANALQANTRGSGNTGIGFNAMYSNVTGANNTATGGAALGLNTSGSNNVAFGVGAGFSQNNSSSTFIGTLADATTTVTNSTALGFQATVDASNQVRIGNSAVTSIGGYSNWTNLSDGRLKRNVNEDVPGMAFINQLRPVTYNLDLDGIDTKLRTSIANRQSTVTKALSILPPSAPELRAKVEKARVRYTGFVAQEVEQAAKRLGYNFSGVDIPKSKDGLYGLRYAEFVVPIVKAVQEQQKKIEQLKERVANLSKGSTSSNTNNSNNYGSSAYFEQNNSNPHTGNTVIRYHLPENAINARVVITNTKGQIVKSIDLNSRGDGQITLDAAMLAADTYNFSLWIGGKEVDTKRMVVVR